MPAQTYDILQESGIFVTVEEGEYQCGGQGREWTKRSLDPKAGGMRRARWGCNESPREEGKARSLSQPPCHSALHPAGPVRAWRARQSRPEGEPIGPP
eukprot:11767734-Prorocentrum_lima.AAC.1